MEAALAAADAFCIDDASCAVTQIWANIHETCFLHGHTHIGLGHLQITPFREYVAAASCLVVWLG